MQETRSIICKMFPILSKKFSTLVCVANLQEWHANVSQYSFLINRAVKFAPYRGDFASTHTQLMHEPPHRREHGDFHKTRKRLRKKQPALFFFSIKQFSEPLPNRICTKKRQANEQLRSASASDDSSSDSTLKRRRGEKQKNRYAQWKGKKAHAVLSSTSIKPMCNLHCLNVCLRSKQAA